jgi:hypothetical protein
VKTHKIKENKNMTRDDCVPDDFPWREKKTNLNPPMLIILISNYFFNVLWIFYTALLSDLIDILW